MSKPAKGFPPTKKTADYACSLARELMAGAR